MREAGAERTIRQDAGRALKVLIEKVHLFVPDGFRDDDGVWWEGPHRLEALRAIDDLRAIVESLTEPATDISVAPKDSAAEPATEEE